MQNEKTIVDFLKYRTDCPYFGGLTPGALYAAYKPLNGSLNRDDSYAYEFVRIGNLTGDQICAILWRLMSYNTQRWGAENPFTFGISAFCNKPGNEKGVLAPIRVALEKFLQANNWSDRIYTNHGDMQIGLTADGYPNKAYKMLSALFAAVRAVADQNVKDFKNPEYRPMIERKLCELYPDKFVSKKSESGFKLDPEFADLRKRISMAKTNIELYSQSSNHVEAAEDARECRFYEEELRLAKIAYNDFIKSVMPRAPFIRKSR